MECKMGLAKDHCLSFHAPWCQECKQEDKEFSGLRQFPTPPTPRTPTPSVNGSEDNSNKEKKQATFTGKSWSPSPRRNLFHKCAQSLEKDTSSYQDLKRQPRTSGKKKPASPTPNLNSEPSPFNVTQHTTGKLSGVVPKQETLWRSRLRYDFKAIGLSEASKQTLLAQLEWNAQHSYIGDVLEQESLGTLGQEPAWTLTLRILEPNSGAVTEVKKLLSSMNFGEVLTSRICSGGWIVTQSTWKSKDHHTFTSLLRFT